ncbi:hypothetical protein DPMN_023697 [Dreissena polymorpha]|uniref:Uncharacterized protein n=1 Tax=Dreissena polymorpha TaxID=45954 RepID=A0A9D4RA55_DREPO|nr:hypothetical protein DPMN_023697 [Dreissena polymorpha]
MPKWLCLSVRGYMLGGYMLGVTLGVTVGLQSYSRYSRYMLGGYNRVTVVATIPVGVTIGLQSGCMLGGYNRVTVRLQPLQSGYSRRVTVNYSRYSKSQVTAGATFGLQSGYSRYMLDVTVGITVGVTCKGVTCKGVTVGVTVGVTCKGVTCKGVTCKGVTVVVWGGGGTGIPNTNDMPTTEQTHMLSKREYQQLR